MITYKETKSGINVLLDGRKVGEIKHVTGGYQYAPKHGSERGEVYATLTEVKQSLESKE